jgi:dynein heavy chain 2
LFCPFPGLLTPPQAQGEAVLRKALSELKLWGIQREFAFVDSKTQGPNVVSGGSKGASVMLIKDWQELMTEVGDQQSLLASLKQSNYYYGFKV